MPAQLKYGSFQVGKTSASANTVITALVPPIGGAPIGNTATPGPAFIHVTDFSYQIGTTGHVITVMRPLNYTWFSAAAAAGQKVVPLHDNPATFSTNYKYPTLNGAAPSTANLTLSSGDYVCYMAADGTWHVDTAASLSGLNLTLTTNNLPTGGVLANCLLYYFGPPPSGTGAGTTDPATGLAQPQFDVVAAASGTSMYTLSTTDSSLWQTLHHGDPLLFYSNNATAQGWFENISGAYYRH